MKILLDNLAEEHGIGVTSRLKHILTRYDQQTAVISLKAWNMGTSSQVIQLK
jgi:hypothetical protein